MSNPQQSEHSSNLYQHNSRKKSWKTGLFAPAIFMIWAFCVLLSFMASLTILAAALKYLFS